MTTPLGKVEIHDEQAAIIFERRFAHPIDAVWAAISEPDHLAAWFGPTTIEGRKGGAIMSEAGPSHVPVEHRRITGRILVWDPPRVLEYEWRQAIVEQSTLRFELVPDGDATVLTLTHRWLSPRNASGFIPGWHAYLDRLEAHLAGAELPDWQGRYALVQPSYGGW